MSIYKALNAKNRGTDAIQNGISYILNPEKTSLQYVAGNGIDIDSACEDMLTVQRLLRKDNGRRYIHYILSFDFGVSVETAFKVSIECAQYFADDFQYILAIHTNTANVHAHVIMNAVNIRTGKKFSQSAKEFFAFRDYINQCLISNGLNPINNKTQNKLVCEVVSNAELFELDEVTYANLPFLRNTTFSEARCLSAYEGCDTFFGHVDLDEATEILQAEQADKKRWEIIHYFEGTSSSLPLDVSFQEAEEIYEQWLQSQPNFDEEDTDHGYFAKRSRCIDS